MRIWDNVTVAEEIECVGGRMSKRELTGAETAVGRPGQDGSGDGETERWAMDSFGRVVIYLSRHYQGYLDANLVRYGISAAHFPLLAYLWEGHTGDTQNDIARALGVDKGTVSRNIHSLVRLGLIAQNPCERDTRACRIDLTESGWALAEPVTKIADRWTDAVTVGLSGEHRSMVLSALQDMTNQAEELMRQAQVERAGLATPIPVDGSAAARLTSGTPTANDTSA